MIGNTRRVSATGAKKCSSNARRSSSSVVSSTAPTCVRPALLTRTSTDPNRSTACSIARSLLAASSTSSSMAVRGDEGEARWWFAALAVIKATAADTGGQMTIVDMTEPPGAQAPLHVHHREDEAFWILEGDVTLEVGDATIEASAGDYALRLGLRARVELAL